MEKENRQVNKRVIEYIDKTSNKLTKKIKIATWSQSIINFFILALNISIIALSGYAIHLGVKQLKNLSDNEANRMVLTITVAVFTILLFVLAIIQSIFKSRAKTYSYKKIYESLRYVHMCYENDENFTSEEYKKQTKQIIKIKDDKPNQKIKDIIYNVLTGGNNA